MKQFLILFAVLVLGTFSLYSQKPMEDDPNVMWTYDATLVHSYTTHPSGNVIISFGNKLIEITGNTGQFIREIATIEDQPTITLTQLTTSQDGKYLAAFGYLASYLFDYQTGQIKKKFDAMDCPNFYPDNNRLLLRNPAKYDSIIAVYNISKDQLKLNSRNNVSGFSKITLSKDGRYFASGGTHEDISYFYLWDAETMKPIRLLEQGDFSTGLSLQIVFSDNSKYVGYAQPGSPGYNRVGYFKIKDSNFMKTYDLSSLSFINETHIVVNQSIGFNKVEIRKVESDELVYFSNISAVLNSYCFDKINNSLLMMTTEGFIALDLSKLITSVSDPKTSPAPIITYLKGILSIEADFINPVSISIIDMTGKTVKSFPPQPINQRIDFPINLIAGAYIVKVADFSTKIMVER
jgi:hypothetical protein